MALLFPQCLPDFFQLVGAVVRFFPDILTDKNGRLGLRSQDNAVTGTGVDFDDLRVDFIRGPQDYPGEIGVAAQGIDHDSFHLDLEGVEDVPDQFMRQGALIMFAPHRHGDGAPNTWLDMDDEAFLLVTDENGQGVLIRGKDPKDFHAHDIRVHK